MLLRVLAALSLVIVLCSPGTASSQPVSAANRFGIVDDQISTSPLAVQRIREAGIGWVHYTLFWHRVNPAPGVYDWSAPDAELANLSAAGLNVYVRIVVPPTWATGASYPNDQAWRFCLDESAGPTQVKAHPDCDPGRPLTPSVPAFRAFVRLAVERYAQRARAWGVGAEAHSLVFWQGDFDQFVRDVLRPGYEVIKDVDPSLLVVGPDEDLGGALVALLALERTYGRWCDVISYHLLSETGGSLARLVEELRDVLDAASAAPLTAGRPIWVTELGFEATGATGQAAAADWLQDMLVDGQAAAGVAYPGIRDLPWIDKVFIHRVRDAGDGGYGLLDANDTPRPAYAAVQRAIAAQDLPQFSYLAEGATGTFFDLDVAIANPNSAPAPVKMSFLKDDGTVSIRTLVMPPLSRTTIHVDAEPGVSAHAASTVVESTTGTPLVVERTMFWDSSRYGGHGGTAVAQPERRWYFAEGSQGFFDTFVLLANTNITAATVEVTFLREQGGPIAHTMVVSANSRANVAASSVDGLSGTSFSIVVTSDLPIIAERAMYFSRSAPECPAGRCFWEAGHESAGVPDLATHWFLAEGATGTYFDTFVLIGNPQTTTATITLSFLTSAGRVFDRVFTMPPLSRTTVHVDGERPELADVAVSTTVTADVPVVVERAMYWPHGPSEWTEAHNGFGATEAALRWGLAEGRRGGPEGFESYILIANPSSQAAEVTITFLGPQGGAVGQVTRRVAPTSRANIGPTEMPHGEFGAIVTSTNGIPVVVERAMYWNALGQPWRGGTNAAATKLP